MSPRNFLNEIVKHHPRFGLNEQQDAHDFLETFIDRLWVHIFKKLFLGKIKFSRKCLSCPYSSDKLEEFISLGLPMPSEPTSLDKCFELFFKEEKVTHACPMCPNQEAILTTSIADLPSVLILQLKRFSFSSVSGGLKNENLVKFPINKVLNLPFSNAQFQLKGVVNHQGTLNNGHYTAFVKNKEQWILCDDNKVTKTNFVSSNAGAYILFYER